MPKTRSTNASKEPSQKLVHYNVVLLFTLKQRAMRKELENIQLIEKYLRNELSSKDKIAFDEKLKSDTKLQKEVELQKEVIRGVERIGVKKSIQTASRRYHNRRRGFFLGLFVAVIVSGVVGINHLNNSPEPTEIISKDVVEITTNDTEQQPEESEPVVEVLDEQETNSELVSLPKKKFQYFSINSSKDETITGAEGTEITFKANSFNVPKNSAIKIRLKEYYKMSDIAFSNLTTETSDGKLLETGGMVFVDALVNNKKADLKKNTFFDIKFPFDKKKKDMLLFDGKTKNKSIVWEESEVFEIEVFEENIVEERVDEVYTIVEQMPEFVGGREKLFEFLGKNTKYPAGAKALGISGKVYVNFMIDNKGEISDVKVLRGVHPLLDREAIRMVESMPNWSPGLQRGKPTNVSYNLPINFKLDGFTSTYTPEQIKLYNDSLIEAQNRDIESNLFKDDGVAEEKNSKDGKIAKADINYYVLSGSKLGWINCDRFLGRGNLNLTIKLDEKNTDVKLIFHRIKSLMSGYNSGLISKFGRIPSGEKVTLFAIKYVDNKPFVCLLETKTSREVINLEFEELTKEKLKDVTKKINQI